ncbi:hypothetical protein HK098_000131 [Nowakowskiella sp. JEL0407]|nr:hypothetical protein HK098_000131 [Nowakowskiella sp. JEL0407]
MSPSPGDYFQIDILTSPSEEKVSNATWEIVDKQGNTMDVIAFSENDNSAAWMIPTNFPPGGEYGVRITANGTVFDSPKNIQIRNTTWNSPNCFVPPYSPITISNVSIAKFTRPSLKNGFSYRHVSTTESIAWTFLSGSWSGGRSGKYKALAEVYLLKEYVNISSLGESACVWSSTEQEISFNSSLPGLVLPAGPFGIFGPARTMMDLIVRLLLRVSAYAQKHLQAHRFLLLCFIERAVL